MLLGSYITPLIEVPLTLFVLSQHTYVANLDASAINERITSFKKDQQKHHRAHECVCDVCLGKEANVKMNFYNQSSVKFAQK